MPDCVPIARVLVGWAQLVHGSLSDGVPKHLPSILAALKQLDPSGATLNLLREITDAAAKQAPKTTADAPGGAAAGGGGGGDAPGGATTPSHHHGTMTVKRWCKAEKIGAGANATVRPPPRAPFPSNRAPPHDAHKRFLRSRFC
jgi:hypothetical protein